MKPTLQLFLLILCGAFCMRSHAQTCTGEVLNISASDPSTSGTKQSWQVPAGGIYRVRITARGAAGGSKLISPAKDAGKGAWISGDFFVASGQVLQAIAGARGQSANQAGGGGGGSGVQIQSSGLLLLLAGGGGGAGADVSSGEGGGAPITNAGTNGGSASNGGGGGGGFGGNGQNSSNSFSGGGGGGGYDGTGGFASTNNIDVGFGGGGFGAGGGGGSICSTISSCSGTGFYYGGGGGGGYSGGNAGIGSVSNFGSGGIGGGSYNIGTNQSNFPNANASSGQVIIQCLGTAAFSAIVTPTIPNCGSNQGSVNIDLTGDLNGFPNDVVEYAIVSGTSFSGNPTFTSIAAEPFDVTNGTGTTPGTYTVRIRLKYNPDLFTDQTYTIGARNATAYVNVNVTGGANDGSSWENAFVSLQDALISTCPGGQIWVAAGTYKPHASDRNASFVMVRDVAIYGGFNGTETQLSARNWTTNETILSGDLGATGNADNSYIVIRNVNNDLTPSNSLLDGFTITGGNNISGSSGNGNGGGMCNINASPSINNCKFLSNVAHYGGGIYNQNASPSLLNCSFSNNTGYDYGGGMYNINSNPALTNVTFLNNRGNIVAGGGVYNQNSSPTLANCTFSGNYSPKGGGMYNRDNSNPDLRGVSFKGNRAEYGGGMDNESSSSPKLTNCIFSGNYGDNFGGGMRNTNSSPILTNVTFSGNWAVTNYGGIANYSSNPVFKNCILWGNSSGVYNDANSTSSYTYCLIEGLNPAGTGNLDGTLFRNNPLFISQPDFTAAPTTTGDLRLLQCSPAIDAGTATDAPTTDLDGNSRVDAHPGGGIVDMGAYEFQLTDVWGRVYVNASASGRNNGSSWADAFTDLQLALSLARTNPSCVSQIWVAAGTYKPTSGTNRGIYFRMVSGVAIYGGFSGGETQLSQRNWSTNVTTLSGDIGEANKSEDNSYHVVYNGVSLSVLDGFTVTGGNADGGGFHTDIGGGMYNETYDQLGVTISNCRFVGNQARNGGGMYNDAGVIKLTNCVFVGNTATKGGGMYNGSVTASPNLVNCVFLGNTATYGGGTYEYAALTTMTNVTLSGNQATLGGGMYFANYPIPNPRALTNCILWGNSSGIFIDNSYDPITYSHCLIQGLNPPGTGNLDGTLASNNPRFVSPPAIGLGTTADLRLQQCSPAIDAGTSTDAPTTDLDGNNRVDAVSGGGTVDIGAYEHQFTYDICSCIGNNGIVYVNASASGGSNNGSSWANAFMDLQSALSVARANPSCVSQIWVAAGTYKPNADASGNTSPADARTKTFVMVNGVAIYGGFSGMGTETELSQRNWRNNPTILSGNIGDTGVDTDNSYRVINNNFTSNSPLGNTAILDGFIVERGYANGGFPLNLGAGMWNAYASPKVQNCVFRNNYAASGGGMFNDNSSSNITNCLFLNNTAITAGAGIANGGGTDIVKVINCTFYGNAGPTTIANERSATSISNSIVWGNAGGISGGTVTYSNVQGGFSGTSNISSDPRFENAAGGDFRLQQCSPAIDAGTNTNAPASDYVGNARPFNATGVSNADMGAYEYQTTFDFCLACANTTGGIVYVNASVSGGSNNGSSWTNAFRDLQSALTLARTYPSCVTQIWVAAGTYKPTSGTDRDISFSMVSGVAIYGGFPTTGSPTMANRNWTTNPTILSGDIDGTADVVTGLSITGNNGNSYHVIFNNNNGLTTTNSLLDGFTITGGSANGSGVNNNGGGMYNSFSSPSLSNVTFSGNQADNGGGMFNLSSSSPNLNNVTFSGNIANQGGGGMYNSFSSPGLSNVNFLGNRATFAGGMFNLDGSPSLSNVTFSGNQADQGGGIYNFSSNPVLKNSILWGNSSEVRNDNNSNPVYTYCLIQGLNPSGTGNLDGTNSKNNPLFVSQPSVGLGTAGDLRLRPCSPAINAGDPATTSATVGNVDLANNPRFFNSSTVDMGAYEYQSAPPTTITPTVGTSNPITCGGSEGNITLSGFLNNTTYSVTYKKNDVVVSAANFTSNGSGVITLTGLGTGDYTDIVATYGACVSNAVTASLENPVSPTATIASNNSPICSGKNATFSINGTTGATLTYTLTGLTGNQTLLLDGTNQTIVANNAPSDVTLTLVSVTKNSCLVSLNATSTVTVNPLPTATIASSNSPICSGNNATFSVNGTTGATLTYTLTGLTGNQTLLLDGTTQTILANNATSDVTLTLVSVTKNNCLVSLNAISTVTVNPSPTATIASNNSPICSGNNATFSINGTTGATLTYTLTGLTGNQTLLLDGTNQTIVANNATSDATLTLVSVTKNNCLVSLNAPSTVTVNPLPTAMIASSNSPICSGNNVTFSVNGTTGATLTYTLTGLTGNQTLLLDGTNQAIVANNATADVTLTLVSVTKNNCLVSLNATSTVTVNPLPTAMIASSNSPICSGNNATFSVNGTTGATLTYTLTGLTGNQTLLLDGTNQTITANNATSDVTLTLVSVTKNNCLVSLNAISTVTVNPLPTATIASNNSPICSGNNATFSVNGTTGATLTYTLTGLTGNQTLLLDGTNQTIVANNATSDVTLTLVSVTKNNCLVSLNATSTVTVNPLPTATIASSNSPICSGNNATFSVNGTTGATLTYTLTGLTGNQTLLLDGTNQTITANNATSDVTLTLVSVTKNSCLVSLNAISTVTVNPLPTATIASSNSPICSGNNATFSINGTTGATLTYTLTGLTGNQTLLLDGTNQTIVANNATSDATLTLVSVTKNNCLVSLNATSTVTVNPLPTAMIASSNSPICSGNNATFSINGTTGATLTYTLTGLTGNQTLLLDGTNQAIVANNATADVTLTLVSVTKNNCLVSLNATSTVTVNPLPTAMIASSNSPICSGNNATFSVNGTTGATLTYTLTGLTGNQTLLLDGTNQTITANNATSDVTLTLVSVTKNNCLVSLNSPSTVTVNPSPTATIASNNSPICSGNNATFSVNGTTGATLTYTLTGLTGNQTLLLDGTNQTITANNATSDVTLTLVSVTKNNCLVSLNATSTVTVNPLPTATIASSNSPICSGNNATFSVNGTTGATLTYTLTGLTGNQTLLLDGTNQTITANNATSDVTLTLVSVTKNNCLVSLNAPSTVTVNPSPTATIASNNSPICSGNNATFSVNGTTGATLTYTLTGLTGNQTLLLDGTNQAIVANNATADVTLTLVSVTKNNCLVSLNATSTVTVNPLPTAMIAGTTTVCQNATSPKITFTGAGGTTPYTFTYKINNGSEQTIVTTSGNSVSLDAPTGQVGIVEYNLVRVKDGSSTLCSQTQMGGVTVTVQGKPTITLSTLQQTLNEGNSQVLCDTDANPVNGLQFTVSGSCVVGNPVWRVQAGSGGWSEWSPNAPVSQSSNNQVHRYQAACDASCPVTYTNPIELTINYRSSTPQNVSLVADGVSVAVGETKEVCNIEGNVITFNATCGLGEILLYSVDGAEYSSTLPVQLVDGQYHNYRVRCRKSDGTVSCVETESGVMRLRIVSSSLVAPVASLNVTSGCGSPVTFSGITNCGALTTIWYNAVTNVALPSLPNQTPTETTSYYARCQAGGGCLSEKSNVVTYTVIPVGVAPSITVSQDIVCTGTTVKISANCPAGSQTFWNTGVTTSSFEVSFSNVTKQSYWAKCLFEGGCQSAESVRKDVYWNAFVVTLINIGQSKSAVKVNDRAAWSSQFITRDGGPELEQSTQVNPTLYYVENANKAAPRYWTINVEACGLSTDGSLTFDMLATPEMGVIRSFNTHENNAPYFMYANREGWTELYAQNHPAYGFYQDNGAGGNSYDAGLPKGLYKLGIRYWDQKGWGSIYPSTRKPQGNVLAYQEYWFRIQSKDGVGVGAAREGANGSGQVAKGKRQGASVQEARGEGQRVFANVMPNPVTNILRLKVQDSKGQVVQAALMDAAGREVMSRQFVPETNTHQEEFGVSALPTGMYFLKVTTSDQQVTLKVVKVE